MSSLRTSDSLLILGIESSCDETAVALLRAPAQRKEKRQEDTPLPAPELLASVISTQIPLHRVYGGVVPELASRNHSLALPHVIREACQKAGVSVQDVDYFAATAGPGLASSLLIGNTTAKALALANQRPFLSINHLEGHLLSPFLLEAEEIPPHLGLIVSGGHTLFVDVQGFGEYHLLGRSLDDAAGEAFDKVGKMLGLPYPGGPEIEKHARGGNPKAYAFPRAMLKEAHAHVSFSGLKTAVLYTLQKLATKSTEDESFATDSPKAEQSSVRSPFSAQQLSDLCASFQQAVTDVLKEKLRFCLRQTGHKILSVSGGVACNQALRTALQELCQEEKVSLRLSPPSLSTDNAAMIAYIGWQKALLGHSDSLLEEIHPNLPLFADELNRGR